LAGKTPAAAREAYLGPLQKALACISHAVFIHNAFEASLGEEYFITLPGGDPVRLACSRGGHYRIRVEQRFHIIHMPGDRQLGPYKIRTRKYEYSLDDDDEREIVAFHWHPREQGFDEPHLHVSAGAGALLENFHRAYLPTGRITFEDFVRFTIRDFSVTALNTGYRKLLDASKAGFNTAKSW
jgi:hypothetical protein